MTDYDKYLRALGTQLTKASNAHARRAWARGEVVPDRITTALNLCDLHGPEVDAALGVEEPAVDDWEAGRLYPRWRDVEALAALTGFGLGYFVKPVTVVLSGLIVCHSSRAVRPTEQRSRILHYPREVVRSTVGVEAI